MAGQEISSCREIALRKESKPKLGEGPAAERTASLAKRGGKGVQSTKLAAGREVQRKT